MGPKDVIHYLFGTNDFVINTMLADLSDEDLLVRPVPGANHIAWQLGHLIESEQKMLNAIPGAEPMLLPPEWAGVHTAESASVDPPKGFATKAAYLEVYKKSRDHVRKILDSYPEADLDRATEGYLAQICPKIGNVFALIANHPMMHVGQLVVVRRMLGKPRVI